MEAQQPPHGEPRRALRRSRSLPIEEKDNPSSASRDDYPVDKNNFSPRLGVTWALDDAGTSVIRGGWGLFYQKTPFTFLTGVVSAGVSSDSFTVNFPANNVDPGPSAGPAADRSVPRQRPGRESRAAEPDVPGRHAAEEHRHGEVRQSRSHLPYTRQASVGYERQFGAAMAVSVDYIRNDLRDLYMRQDLNPGVRASTARTATVTRVNPNFTASVREITNLGWSNSDSLQFSLVKRYTRGYQYRVAYTLSQTFGNVPSPGAIDLIDTQVLNDLHLELAEARTSQDRPHVLSLTGAAEIPKTGGLQLSGSFQYQSGAPFTLTDSTTDDNRNGLFTDNVLPAGTYSGAAGNPDAITVENEGGFRGARGPDQLLLSLRGRYSFKLGGGRSLQAWVDVFNLTNRANFNTPSSDRRDTATFLILRGVANPTRTAQLNFRFVF